MEILGNIKNYDWGKLGAASKVAHLAKLSDPKFEVDSGSPYAELWMGDHVSGPSIVKGTGESLVDFIKNNKEAVGGMSALPFLFKVLSIRKALSIQVHPNKKEAERLHAERPDIYKDPNHKPELAIALTPFLALCGFRPFEDIQSVLKNYPDIAKLIGDKAVSEFNAKPSPETLKSCFEILMRANESQLSTCITSLLATFKKQSKLSRYEETFVRLNEDFPNDVGSLSLFFLNLIQLKPGEAINLAANVIHAYLDGDCIECMACSDNVVRAGLTPKYKDVDTLVSMLEYEGKNTDEILYKSKDLGANQKYSKVFIPLVKDFAVVQTQIPSGTTTYKILNRKYGSILLVLSGKGTLKTNNGELEVLEGSIVFLSATLGPEVDLTITDTSLEFVAYQAMYNDFE
ncbi:mannose-6-phosphate isomerase [Culicoides brevitarsis]|uniref:mannose-6-phosphate isomerase n=1 Tax=Culicoides brevitarsis TaxID=469753 RepID=UPI00307B8830